MLKALRIASIGAVVFAAAVLAAVAAAGFRGDPEIEKFLSREGVIEQFRKKSQTVTPAKSDLVSPLEQAARSFALRIDPPAPPAPVKPIEAPKPPTVKPPTVAQPPKPAPENRPTLSAKFTLLATARYPEHSEKSMALLQNVQNEYKWYRQGDLVGHLEIREIKDGSIVLYQDGKFHSELFMPAPPRVKSLLKSDEAVSSAGSGGPTSVSVSLSESQDAGADSESLPQSAEEGAVRPSVVSRRTISSSQNPPRLSRPSPAPAPGRIPSAVLTEAPAVPMTPEEQLRSIDENIRSIENIIQRSSAEGQSEEERQAEQAAWQELLKALNQEKEKLQELQTEAAPAETPEPVPAETKGPEGSEKTD